MRCLMSIAAILPPAARNPRYPRKIGPRAHVLQAGARQQFAYWGVLADAVLDEQPAARFDVPRRLRGDGADGVQSVGPGDERVRGLMGESSEMRVASRHVRGVGDDEVV